MKITLSSWVMETALKSIPDSSLVTKFESNRSCKFLFTSKKLLRFLSVWFDVAVRFMQQKLPIVVQIAVSTYHKLRHDIFSNRVGLLWINIGWYQAKFVLWEPDTYW